ncbi:methyltransferase domain-containing protein [Pradoshia sp. D12]|uniref:methyltransferase domain-containing protein n=1 Tax=Bacillaceae TaxID=186817 RepID=UPI00112B7D52|nr:MULTISPECIES: methyltransferase domain-containing protein [Bacillaceae]QFK70230.1 methyltransferase domain-containing protein [Pradoshia sp. D12]TPF71010.1 methyltransferase domain-containing protein [Bacillus sp. D12]
MNEKDYDDLLHIKTVGNQTGFYNSMHYHRYEPTPYWVLEKLLDEYDLNSDDHMVDFGCGKGRLNFFLHYKTGAFVSGVEMNEQFINEAEENLKNYNYKGKDRIQFHCCLAEEFQIQPTYNRFYFFNPFTIQIFRQVLTNILLSVEETYREVHLILYYPSEDYIYFLENQSVFELHKEIVLNETNPFERILIYRLAY